MDTPDTVKDAACDIILKAEVAALLGMIQELAEMLKVETLDGLPLMEWFVRQRKIQLQEEVRMVADHSPALAAMIQKAADQTMD